MVDTDGSLNGQRNAQKRDFDFITIGGLHCCHVGGQKKKIFSQSLHKNGSELPEEKNLFVPVHQHGSHRKRVWVRVRVRVKRGVGVIFLKPSCQFGFLKILAFKHLFISAIYIVLPPGGALDPCLGIGVPLGV